MSIFFITGTDTDAGKTVATALLCNFLSDNGQNFIPYKPIQTGAILQEGSLVAPDILTYELSSGQKQPSATYLFTTPCSPHLAASLDHKQIDIERLTQSINKLIERREGILVEGAGGLYVPLTHDGYCMIDWMQELDAAVILVARAGVGTINHTLLSIEAMRARGIHIAGLLFNDLANDDPEIINDNMEMIKKLSSVPVIGMIPYQRDIHETLLDAEKKKKCYEEWNYTILEEALQNGCKSVN